MTETEMITVARLDWQNLYAITGCLMGIILGVMIASTIMLFKGDN